MTILNKIQKEFSYNPDTGKIVRLTRKNSNGSYDKDGYLIIKFQKKQYKAHRLAWFLYYGEFPKNVINHKNAIRDDNRIENLEDVSQRINCKKTKHNPNSETKIIGVHIDKKTKGLKAKYTTRINGKQFRFRELDEAIKARKQFNLYL